MLLIKLIDLSSVEESGMPSVAVECVAMRRHISSEADFLDCN